MTLGELLKNTRGLFRKAGLPNADLDARVLIRESLVLSNEDFIVNEHEEINEGMHKRAQVFIQRRLLGEPVSKILGKREFWGLEFKVTADTLDPRPETELLVESVLQYARPDQIISILDLGTGTGCILISILHELPAAFGSAVDISPEALEIARHNASKHQVDDRIQFYEGSWFNPVPPKSLFDFIVTNPPYIPNPDIESLNSEVKNHDPILALRGGDDGLNAYRSILSKIKNHLKPDGKAFFEIGFGQAEDITRLVDDSNATLSRVIPDLAGIPRVVEIVSGDK